MQQAGRQFRFNTQGKCIKIYRNGDVHHKCITICVNMRQMYGMPALLDTISEKIGLVLGARRLYAMDGRQIVSLDQLEHNKEYVAASGPFSRVDYGRQLSNQSSVPFRRGSISSGENQSISNKTNLTSSTNSYPQHKTLRQAKSQEFNGKFLQNKRDKMFAVQQENWITRKEKDRSVSKKRKTKKVAPKKEFKEKEVQTSITPNRAARSKSNLSFEYEARSPKLELKSEHKIRSKSNVDEVGDECEVCGKMCQSMADTDAFRVKEHPTEVELIEELTPNPRIRTRIRVMDVEIIKYDEKNSVEGGEMEEDDRDYENKIGKMKSDEQDDEEEEVHRINTVETIETPMEEGAETELEEAERTKEVAEVLLQQAETIKLEANTLLQQNDASEEAKSLLEVTEITKELAETLLEEAEMKERNAEMLLAEPEDLIAITEQIKEENVMKETEALLKEDEMKDELESLLSEIKQNKEETEEENAKEGLEQAEEEAREEAEIWPEVAEMKETIETKLEGEEMLVEVAEKVKEEAESLLEIVAEVREDEKEKLLQESERKASADSKILPKSAESQKEMTTETMVAEAEEILATEAKLLQKAGAEEEGKILLEGKQRLEETGGKMDGKEREK